MTNYLLQALRATMENAAEAAAYLKK